MLHTMAPFSSSIHNGGPDHIIRPRPNKASNPMVQRAQSEEASLKPNGHGDTVLSGVSRYAGYQVLTQGIQLSL